MNEPCGLGLANFIERDTLALEIGRFLPFVSGRLGYEKILFGATPTQESLEKLNSLKSAMMDLNKIVNTQEKARYISWAREWFANMGYDAANPITDFLLVNMWMQEFIGTAKAIKECLGALP